MIQFNLGTEFANLKRNCYKLFDKSQVLFYVKFSILFTFVRRVQEYYSQFDKVRLHMIRYNLQFFKWGNNVFFISTLCFG